MFSIGIVGLPNVGKSTLFQALTKKQVDIANYPFCTVEPNKGIIEVPDLKLDKLTEISKSQRKVPTAIEFVDIAGLVRGANKGEGLGNQFLAQIREVNLIVEVVRNFSKKDIIHVNGQINPKDDIEIINLELIMKDLETVEKHLAKIRKESRSQNTNSEELVLLEKIVEWLKNEKLIYDLVISIETQSKKKIIKKILQDLHLLTAKPIIYLLNNDIGQEVENFPYNPIINLDVKLELETIGLSSAERQELGAPPSKLDSLIRLCYDTLNQITFYTTGEDETRAWTVKRGATADVAAGKIHSDFQKKFICAEVIDYQTLIDCGQWKKAKENGLVRTEGKNYLVKDGDIMIFKI
ncbi:MAG TPA: redox-regulated ATPase YchF [Candidatus Portnoybacteria bacterium]|nr:redox-regulated ATPase YchF [Candidatus Portnoybacteria bacterium]